MRSSSDERGAVAVEMALITPILVMLVFGIIQFGIVFAQKLALSNAARESARLGVVQTPGAPQPTCSDIITAARNRAQTVAMPGGTAVAVEIRQLANVTSPVTGTPLCGATGASMSNGATSPCDGSTSTGALAVTTKYSSSLIIPFSVVSDPLGLDGTGVYRCEYH